MQTLLLFARQTDDAQLLWRACIRTNWEVVRVHGWRLPSVSSTELAIYGEPLFARHIAQSLGLKLHEPPIDWLPKLPNTWRGREVRLTTLNEARRVSTRAFIKPADEKCFDAKIYSSGADLPPIGPLPEDLPVLVQEVVGWDLEFRCFVMDRKVVTLSIYWRDGQLAKAEDGSWPASDAELSAAKRFCERFLADPSVSVPQAIVIDVGIINQRGWGVIESNAAFSSGLYGCEPEKVLQVLLRACQAAQ